MSKTTLHDRLVLGLRSQGWVVSKGRSRFTELSKAGENRRYFVGPNGALRTGRNATNSFSVGDASRQTQVYEWLLSEGDKVLDPLKEYTDDPPQQP